MNYRQLLLIPLAIAPICALAEPPSQVPSAGGGSTATQTQAQAQAQPQVAAPAPSSSIGEFVQRTATVARLQAEDEVHYETRRQVRGVFDRILQR